MGGFRRILREILAAMRAGAAAVGRVAHGAFHVADDIAEYVARVMRAIAQGRGVPVDEDVLDAADDLTTARDRDGAEEAYEAVGRYARRAAEERLVHGVVVSPDIPTPLRSWVSVLPRETLRILVQRTDAEVGRHMAGDECIRDNIGAPLPRPQADDETKYRSRLAERERREAHWGVKCVLPRQAPTPGGPAIPLLN